MYITINVRQTFGYIILFYARTKEKELELSGLWNEVYMKMGKK